MTVYELIRELVTCNPNGEVEFDWQVEEEPPLLEPCTVLCLDFKEIKSNWNGKIYTIKLSC